MVMKEGKTELASNQITASLGNTINGNQSVQGVDPTQFKQNMQVMSDMAQQAETSNITGPTAATPINAEDQRDAKEATVNALLGKTDQTDQFDLSAVPDDQLDLLVQNAALMGGKK